MSVNRREAIRNISLMLGGVALSDDILAAMAGERTHLGDSIQISPGQKELLIELADVIIPTTSTPGAKSAGAEAFIIRVVRDCQPLGKQKEFYASLDKFDQASQAAYGSRFAALTNQQRISMVNRLMATDPVFFRQIKQLTAAGYFTSEIGATQALVYVETPGRLEACIPMAPDQKSWAL